MTPSILDRVLPRSRYLGPEQSSGLRLLRSKLQDLRSRVLTAKYRRRISYTATPDVSIAMLHTGRVGSTVVAKQLEQHPDLTWDGEVFERVLDYQERGQGAEYPELLAEDLTPEELIRARQVASFPHSYGIEIKVHPDQHLRESLINDSVAGTIDMLKNIGFNYFVFLYRENYIRQIASATVAKVNNQYFRKHGESKITSVKIPLRFSSHSSSYTLIDYFQLLDKIKIESANSIDKNLLILRYENDILNDPSLAYEKILKHTGLSYFPSRITLKRTNPFNLYDIISNFNEVESLLCGTDYEWMTK